ncbi:MAG: 16S rRNA (guanine(527)-N(7))-methyltransferase RsmG [Deltaproteobacteria bacterium]|jgi:16S rRNA (guanine527-N7)-methyltransferase|nr:16S rRNA (guanine(527)-N(7))-methyltransferase RsmG [Deltaproteobacteria bacterium]
MVAELLEKCLDILNIDVKNDYKQTLISYWILLLSKNETINLISPHGSLEYKVVNHLVDSLTPLRLPWPRGMRIMDFGSGGGLPGIPLQIFNPGWYVTLVESKLKKANFLKEVTQDLKLKNCNVIDSRVDGSYQFKDGLFELIVARAIGKIYDIIPKINKFLKVGGIFLAYKGPKYAEELALSQPVLKKYNYQLNHKEFFTLPYVNAERNLLVFKKL